jgi:hypothetical protein
MERFAQAIEFAVSVHHLPPMAPRWLADKPVATVNRICAIAG